MIEVRRANPWLAERSVSRKFRQAPLFLGIFSARVLLGAAVSLISVNLITLLIFTQVLQGLLTPIILTFIVVLPNRRSVLGNAVNGRSFRKVAAVSIVGIGCLSFVLIIQTVIGWL